MATREEEGRGMLATYEVTKNDKRFIGAHILVAVIALSIGSLFGPLQAFQFSGVDLYPYLQPVFKSYYQGLTIHGVLNALIWTTFFITGFFTLTIIVGFKRGLRYPKLNRIGFWTMV
ncbi:MAG: cbb3-type cytochrome c oxidase subunit I, partial [Acidimicrobiia bacterium]